MNGWGTATEGLVEHHRVQYRRNRRSTQDITAEPLLGETLGMIGATWLAETSRSHQIADQVSGTVTIAHHLAGVVGQNESPYIDLPM